MFFVHLLMEYYMCIDFNLNSYQTKNEEPNYEDVSLTMPILCFFNYNFAKQYSYVDSNNKKT